MTYPVGAFYLTQIGGWRGFLVGVGQALCGAPSRYEHAGVIVTADGGTVEAQPGGARRGHLSAYAGRPLLVCDGPILRQVAARPHVSDGERTVRQAVAAQARGFVGTPYSALDYLALALLHLRLPDRWVRRRVQTSGRMICSQLVDACYRAVGIHLFTDGRLPGDTMPADLAAWAEDFFAAQRTAVAP